MDTLAVENGGNRILVVEDDNDTRELLRRWLEGEGHDVTVANTGERGAMLLTEEGDFDLMTVDVRLPGIDGFEVMRRAQVAAEPPTPALLVTVTDAEDLPDDVTAVGHVSKPFTKGELLRAVAGALQS
jgi:CheY-like chemotaxis protein